MRPIILPHTNQPLLRPRAFARWLALVACFSPAWVSVPIVFAQTPDPLDPIRIQLQPTTSLSTTASTSSVDAGLALSRRGSVVFRDTPLNEVILILSDQWDINIVAGAQIDGTVSGTFKNETLEKILDSLLTANGFSYRRIGNSLVIVASEQAHSSRPSFTVEVIDIPLNSSEQLDELIEALKLQMSPEGRLQPIKSSGKFAISDTPDRIEAVKALLRQIVEPSPQYISTDTSPEAISARELPAQLAPTLGTIELRPQFLTAKDLQQPLSMLLGEAAMAIVEAENVIVVFGDAEIQNKARLLLQQLDHPRAQVRITGYIYDVDLSEIERLGVDWNNQFMSRGLDANGIPRNLGLSQTGLLVPNAPNNATGVATGLANTAAATAGTAGTTTAAASATGGQFLFRTLNSNVELQAMIQALDQTDGSRLLADPHVTVVDRHTASLGIVTEIPVQQLTQTQQGGSIGTTTFREAGITLEVTPRIASDGTIEMEVSPEFSVLAGFQDGNPIIDTRRASTTVRVTHGQALVIGGLRSKSTVETVKGIPGLMNARFIGKLFRTHSTDVRESELIVFIMPEIVGYCGGLEREMHALDVTQQQLSRVSTAVDGVFTPPCGDKNCPNHCERPRIHNGMQDNGLIGGNDTIFINPQAPVMVFPTDSSPLPSRNNQQPTINDVEPFPLTRASSDAYSAIVKLQWRPSAQDIDARPTTIGNRVEGNQRNTISQPVKIQSQILPASFEK